MVLLTELMTKKNSLFSNYSRHTLRLRQIYIHLFAESSFIHFSLNFYLLKIQDFQRVILGYDCIDLNTGMAAIILTLVGVPPQHNAPDRNKHIEIVEDNIIPGNIHNIYNYICVGRQS